MPVIVGNNIPSNLLLACVILGILTAIFVRFLIRIERFVKIDRLRIFRFLLFPVKVCGIPVARFFWNKVRPVSDRVLFAERAGKGQFKAFGRITFV
ncbi:hypothetical protein D3C78_1074000 [compost metagenome]